MIELEENNIPLAYDYKFKKVFGDNDGIKRVEEFIRLYFNLSKE